MTKLLLALLIALPALAGGNYVVMQDSTTTASKVTVRIPANSRGSVAGIAVYVYCGAACEAYVERGGDAPTATQVTPTKVNESDDAPRSVGFTASNAGAGTKIGPSILIPAGGSTSLDLTNVNLTSNQQFSVVVSGSSSRQIVAIQYRER